jgi:hypothetical protein
MVGNKGIGAGDYEAGFEFERFLSSAAVLMIANLVLNLGQTSLRILVRKNAFSFFSMINVSFLWIVSLEGL